MLHAGLRDDPEAERALATAEAEVERSLDELGALVRGGRPAALDAGLETALRSLVDRSPVPASLHYEGGGALPEQVEAAAYFVAAEALTNVAKYARAERATVRVRREGRVVTVAIEDDGVGGADMAAGTGLRGLRDRLAGVGGRLMVRTAPGEGTSVVAELPAGGEGAG
jgi:signal transduction histidine kinase